MLVKQLNNGIPVQLDITQNPLLIVGGEEKALNILKWILSKNKNAQVKVVSPTIMEEIKAVAWKKENVKVIRSPFMQSDLDGVRGVIATAGSASLLDRLIRNAEKRNVWLSMLPDPQVSHFHLPLEEIFAESEAFTPASVG